MVKVEKSESLATEGSIVISLEFSKPATVVALSMLELSVENVESTVISFTCVESVSAIDEDGEVSVEAVVVLFFRGAEKFIYPHDLLEAAEIDRMAQMLITMFHNIPLADVLPANWNAVIYPMPAIMQDETNTSWLRKMTVTMPLTMAIASPCSTAEFTYINNILMQHPQLLDDVTCTMLYNYTWFCPDGNPRTGLSEWMNHIPECKPAYDQDPGVYICNFFTLRPIIFDKNVKMETQIEVFDIDDYDDINNPH
uniref:Uncharacterized protein n=1 Tax=Romanomermis culicivorax TaxID=13658 RepID=A0A915KQR2_ROMCU